MSREYEIKIMNCDICFNYLEIINKAQKYFPDLFTKGRFRIGSTKEERKLYEQKIVELRKNQEKKCFYFLADCGGDSISICKDCLKNIINEIEPQPTTVFTESPFAGQ